MTRRRSAPWIHRWSRPLIGAIALLGALDTAYLTLVELGVFKEAALCPTSGVINCQAVLTSSYAKLFGVPLSLFGFLAYVGIALFAFAPQLLKSSNNKELRAKVEDWSWLLIFAGATAMVVFSGYLVYLMSFKIGAFCIYCLASAVCSVALFVLTIIGRAWEDIGQLFFTGIVVGMVALIGTLGVYATGAPVATSQVTDGVIPLASGTPKPPNGWEITTTSSEAEIALARHLTEVGAKEYGAFWCPHCFEQKQLFGKEAFTEVDYVECDPAGKNPQPQACQGAGIQSYPSWEINGKLYLGVQTLNELADLTNYQGSRDFKYTLPGR
ncbi:MULTISPECIES: vitamin K epoxide reductase family protein [unclassified Coleofasciculus]|uniref:vitamin K epoxide reductase family protein n=1 Tax=unclassified Coleofasciculus TaxID=2692782 RepID=UPI0018806574|nr:MULTISPECIES: vitamin K epoxide reductase family protein [unclassified Coleofasciculus]MBE9127195.1 vitamin K epoxide reductase family protein [Coleofasciculus sp. LEGE 07081]MBE9150305.1 vitamin K epoxide reductase family protein [Coleofasciculus sp. LEGE 07092]